MARPLGDCASQLGESAVLELADMVGLEFELLYRRARMMLLQGAVLGGVMGFIVALVTVSMTGGPADLGQPAGIALLVGAIIGAAWGHSRSFALRLQAQTALCQVEIEKHLRMLAGRAEHPPRRPPTPR